MISFPLPLRLFLKYGVLVGIDDKAERVYATIMV